MSTARVMVVEDEAVTAMALEESLQRLGYEVAAIVPTGEEAVTLARQEHLDVVLMDIRLRGLMDGIAAAQRIREEVDVPCVYVTAYSDVDTIKRAKIAEPAGYLVKPYDEKELRAAIEIALHANEVARGRKSARDAVEAREKTLQDIIDHSPALIYLKDTHGRYTLANRRFEQVFGVARGDVRGKEDAEVLPGFAASLAAFDERVLRTGAPEQREQAVVLPDGVHHYVSLRFPLLRRDGGAYGVCAVLTDITDMKNVQDEMARLQSELEARVRDRTAELKRVNERLQTFNHTISHDLRAPVRGIASLADELEDRYAAKLNTHGTELVGLIRKESQRLSALINELLEYSRSAGATLSRRSTDLTRLARVIVDDLQKASPERETRVVIEDGLVADCDPSLVRVVLENLLGNAWKFSSRTPDARIDVGQTVAPDGSRAFFVRDNGVGFDEEQAARLFTPFARLHGGQFPGTGLGLSSVRSIVERHGGTITASGRPGKGATFTFTLPSRAAA